MRQFLILRFGGKLSKAILVDKRRICVWIHRNYASQFVMVYDKKLDCAKCALKDKIVGQLSSCKGVSL